MSGTEDALAPVRTGVSLLSKLVGAALLIGGLLAISLTPLRDFALRHAVGVAYAGLGALLALVWLLPVALGVNARLTARVRALEAENATLRRVPTDRDRRQFAEFLEYWDWNAELGVWLRTNATGRKWSFDVDSRIYAWTSRHSHELYDDVDVDRAHWLFLTVVRDVYRWMTYHTHKLEDGSGMYVYDEPKQSDAQKTDIQSILRRVTNPEVQLHDRLVEARREFERVGRSRGL